MACFSVEEVANMFQNGTVDEIIDKFDETFLDDISSKIGINFADNLTIDTKGRSLMLFMENGCQYQNLHRKLEVHAQRLRV